MTKMARLVLRFALYLFLGLLACSSFGQDATFDFHNVMKDISARCEAPKEYAFEAELQLAGQRGAEPGRILAQAKVKLAVAQPGKYLLQVEPIDKDEYWLVSDGQKSWAYVPKLKQYTEQESAAITDDGHDGDDSGEASSDDEHDLAETFARQVVPTLAKWYKTAEGAEVKELGDVKYEGKKEKWPVIRAISRPNGDGSRDRTDVTVDPSTLRIGRLLWINVRQSNGEKITMQLTVSFSRFAVTENLSGSTFVFEPPKKAKLVDTVPIPGQTGSFLLNHAAPDFELKTLEGDRVHLSELRGHPVLLSFWASWCGPCRRELPGVAKVSEDFKDKLLVFGVNDEGKGVARQYLAKANLPIATLDDSGLKVHRLYRVRAIPSVFLIDGDGKVVRFFRGTHDEASLRAALKGVGL
jgi:thiol-disulfide isomerase/thioredoxin/outer membrane lipoprotein-sorting protein